MQHFGSLVPGSHFAQRYEIIAPLAQGGMGTVYLACAIDRRDFLVALKVLDPSLLSSPEALSRFRSEIVASYKVEHPNVVRSYEYFDEPNLQAYAMEYVEGSSLRSMLRSGPLDVQFAVAILLQIAAGLEAVHAEGVVHRDLKPENILVSKKGEVKIGDFGVARLSNAQSVTHVNALVGTADYVAPEYIETGECDARGDIYAVGVIGYEMLAGHSPFPAVQTAAALAERFAAKPQPLLTAAPRCPRPVAVVIERAMEHRLGSRFQSAAELRTALKQVHDHMWAEREEDIDSVTATLTHTPDPLVATMRLDPAVVKAAQTRRSRMPIWIGASVLAALLAVGGALLSMSLQTSPAPEQSGNIQAERERFLGP